VEVGIDALHNSDSCGGRQRNGGRGEDEEGEAGGGRGGGCRRVERRVRGPDLLQVRAAGGAAVRRHGAAAGRHQAAEGAAAARGAGGRGDRGDTAG